MRRADRPRVARLALCQFLFIFASWLFVVYLPIYLRNELEPPMSPDRIGALISVYMFTTLLLILPLGYLSDRVSERRILQVGAGLFVVYAALLLVVRSFWGLLAVQLTGGTGEAILLIVLPALLYKKLGPVQRGRRVSGFIAAGLLGCAVAPYPCALLVEKAHLPYTTLFGISFGASVLLFVAVSCLEETPPFAIRIADYLPDIRRREVLLVVIAICGLGIHAGQERTDLSLYFRNVAQFSLLELSLLFSLFGLWTAALTRLMGRLFDRNTHLLLLLGVGLALSGGLHIATAHVRTIGLVLGVRLLHTVGDVIVIFCYSVMVASIFPQQRLGGNSGFTYLFRATGAVVGAAVAGQLDKLFPSLQVSFAAAGGAMIVCGAVLLLNWRTLARVSRGMRVAVGN